MHAMKRMNNDVAVSPIVATLVLIVVAVIGAVAVGTIMGTFSSDVSKKASAEGASSASQTEILSAGSTTVQPASELIAKAYMAENPGVKITVQGGGSGAGVQSVGEGIVDIGASSSLSKITAKITDGTYPNLKYYQIGSSAVVWIVNKDHKLSTVTSANATELKGLSGTTAYTPTGNMTGITTLVQRSDSSGTEETAAGWVGAGSSFDNANSAQTKAVSGNSGVLSEIAGDSTGTEVGFVDYGYVFDNSGNQLTTGNAAKVTVLSVDGGSKGLYTVTRTNVLNGCKDLLKGNAQDTTSGPNYPQGLTRGLYYITNGQPSSVVKNYITFAQSPGATDSIHDAGMFANSDLA